MNGDVNQMLLLVVGFFAALTGMLVALDRLESSLSAPPSRFVQRALERLRRLTR